MNPFNRAPGPMSDHSSHKFEYLDLKDTPSHTENEPRPLNDFNTTVKQTEAFESGKIKVVSDEQVEKFSKTSSVDQDLVISAIEDLEAR